VSGHDIFLSYSREDRAAARHFADSFAAEGFTVWWDAALRSGQTFDEVIEKELRAAKAVVVLWSPRSVASRWVRAEATLADRRNKLVPAIIEACDRPIIFELTHAADLADWTGDTSDVRWRTLINDLRRLVGGGEDEDADEPVAARPAAKPISVPAEPVSEPIREAAESKPLAPADVDELMFAAARLREARGGGRLAKPKSPEEVDHAEYGAPSDPFDVHGGDDVHCLKMIDALGHETKFVVGPMGVRIGRTAPADIVLPSTAVSRAHCVVELVGHQVRVMDMNSTNGTYIDDDRIDGVAVLPLGSVLRVGNVTFTHEIRTQAETQLAGNPAAIERASNPRLARVARSS
jgi:hypothetical protein